jgi:hypothetical protein
MNSFDELKDGLIILDILKFLTKKLNCNENYFYEFIRLSKLKVSIKERFEFVLNTVNEIYLKNEFNEKIEIEEKTLEVILLDYIFIIFFIIFFVFFYYFFRIFFLFFFFFLF